MVFPETVAFEFVLFKLEEELANSSPPPPDPLPCDRWIARSCLQKAIRRGETETALRALATLLVHDPRAVWRHLIVIALEDVGVVEMDTVRQVVASARNRAWRQHNGGDWSVASFLVKRMSEGVHCQAACDLLLRATNCPTLEGRRQHAIEAESRELVEILSDKDSSLENRAVAAMAIGGGFVKRPGSDPALALCALNEAEASAEIVATSSAAWTSSRNQMSLLLPLVWKLWAASGGVSITRDDPRPRCRQMGEIPEYAIDQFTRAGLQVARAYVAQDPVMRSLLNDAQVAAPDQARCVADLLFLIEGGLVRRRAIWPFAERMRTPFRALSGAIRLGSLTQGAMERLKSKLGEVRKLRSQYLQLGTRIAKS